MVVLVAGLMTAHAVHLNERDKPRGLTTDRGIA